MTRHRVKAGSVLWQALVDAENKAKAEGLASQAHENQPMGSNNQEDIDLALEFLQESEAEGLFPPDIVDRVVADGMLYSVFVETLNNGSDWVQQLSGNPLMMQPSSSEIGSQVLAESEVDSNPQNYPGSSSASTVSPSGGSETELEEVVDSKDVENQTSTSH